MLRVLFGSMLFVGLLFGNLAFSEERRLEELRDETDCSRL